MNNDVFTLEEGEAVLQWPARMSPESYEEFKAWLDLIARKAKRAAGKQDYHYQCAPGPLTFPFTLLD